MIGRTRSDLTCKEEGEEGEEDSHHPCLPAGYNKFELPFPDTVNLINIGIDTTYVLRINDRVITLDLNKLECLFSRNVPWSLAVILMSCGQNLGWIFPVDF